MALLTHWYLMAMQHPYDVTWNAVGFLAQFVFGIRFIIQWLKSEQEGRSVVPIMFWYCSLIGGGMNLVYVVHLGAWPLVLGATVPLPIYARNIWLIYRTHARSSASV